MRLAGLKLVGDDLQHDPERYRGLQRSHAWSVWQNTYCVDVIATYSTRSDSITAWERS